MSGEIDGPFECRLGFGVLLCGQQNLAEPDPGHGIVGMAGDIAPGRCDGPIQVPRLLGQRDLQLRQALRERHAVAELVQALLRFPKSPLLVKEGDQLFAERYVPSAKTDGLLVSIDGFVVLVLLVNQAFKRVHSGPVGTLDLKSGRKFRSFREARILRALRPFQEPLCSQKQPRPLLAFPDFRSCSSHRAASSLRFCSGASPASSLSKNGLFGSSFCASTSSR